jgi:hypothetical protein
MNSCETLPLHPHREKHFVEENSAVGRWHIYQLSDHKSKPALSNTNQKTVNMHLTLKRRIWNFFESDHSVGSGKNQ